MALLEKCVDITAHSEQMNINILFCVVQSFFLALPTAALRVGVFPCASMVPGWWRIFRLGAKLSARMGQKVQVRCFSTCRSLTHTHCILMYQPAADRYSLVKTMHSSAVNVVPIKAQFPPV